MKKILIGIICLCLFQPIGINAQVVQHQISDDGYARVPLQFPFPYHGRVFTESFMFSNGVVGFLNPTNHWCCSGFDLANTRGTPFDYAIMPLQTDLINYNGRFLTEGTTTYQRYKWENISEYGAPQNLNTFGVEIRPTGFVGMYYEKVNISPWRNVTIGMTGDTSVGEFTQHYHGAGFSSNEIVSYITQNTGDRCLSEPLSSISCPGYAQAYLAQQCAINPLYDSSCAGYAQAYQAQQCSLNVLYNEQCPGYEVAYFNQQCNRNPLYDTRCTGYAEAYFNQQCRANALFDRTCPGYNEAYALTNIVTTPAVTVSAPTVPGSTTGTVSIETPVVSDPVVNEVITRPTTNVNAQVQQTTTSSPTSVTTQAEPKQEKKTETKQVATVKRAEVKNEVTATAPAITDIQIQQPNVLIIDMMYKKLIKKPIQDNNRAYYALIMGSQKTHEEMVDEQYRR